MKNDDLVSIITPSYNSEKYIASTITSVLSQTYQNWEMIIVDDMSPDNANNVIDKFVLLDSRIILIKLDRNVGVAEARNRAIQIAKGRYIAFLDSDDIWLNTKLEKQIEHMRKFQQPISFSSYFLIDANGNRIGSIKSKLPTSYKDLLKYNKIGNLTGIYDVSFFGKHYLESVGHEDYILWLKLTKIYKKNLVGIGEELAEYRISTNSLSANKFRAAKWQWSIYRHVEKISFFKSIYLMSYYLMHGVTKAIMIRYAKFCKFES